MNPLAFLTLALLSLAGCTGLPPVTTADGLVGARSSKLDALYLRPNSDVARYRKVLIEPVPVEFRSDYLKQTHAYNRLQSPHAPYQAPAEVANDMAAEMQTSLAEAFTRAGYMVVGAPQADTLRISVKISELFIAAPDRQAAALRIMLTRDAGQATLSLEASDATSGAVLARVVHHAIAREVSRINVASDVSNQLWFSTMFRRWTANCVAQFGHSRRSEISLAN